MKTLREVAAELDQSVADVRIVAEVELEVPAEYDDELETVSEIGYVRLIEHFHGGRDLHD